ncbi:glucose-6-phosphatase 2-like [Argiope bruennichi]|uniref:glucose-6-phosphatase n=1 Tax=Argiope bruennichi TaxID=94029 RepID=A0A8T0E290_ARGBR|nr:glucose-6-phosphatase 2-like [Argiope bruennichi]KAF8764563.1 Glucose-6-phosphatase 2 like protein [Argiope bruennichi]
MANVLTGTMDVVYENSVSAIEGLQARFLQQSDVFFLISNLFDPRYAFLVYSPLFLSLDWRVGKKIMWVTVIAEWVNQMLKWALHGERPYWWIHETQVYNRTGISTPDIQQFSLTCETGPGSPSGHSMVTAGVWYVILDAFLEKFNFNRKDSNSLVPKICWLAYIVLLTTVSASRVFIAAHFPHQCFIGMALGWLVAKKLNNITQQQVGTFLYCAITAGMLASALSMYAFLTAIGVDPMWSVGRAIKWCAKPEYVHLDTSPFFSMMRYCGFMFGMGFGFNSKSFKENSKSKFTLAMRIACAIISVGVCKLSEKVSLLRINMFLFYVQAFLLNALLSYIMIAAAPYIVSKIWNTKAKQKAQ